MGAREELVAALDAGRIADARAFVAVRPLWRDGRVAWPAGRVRQHMLFARDVLRAAACDGLLSEEEARAALELCAPEEDGRAE